MNKIAEAGYDGACQEGFLNMKEQTERAEQIRCMAERMWLHYYNRVLYERRMISEDEWVRMNNRIDRR